jgi:hypothetical protein
MRNLSRIGLVHAGTMQLHYLEFDFSDEDSGCGSFDAMAAVLPDRLPLLLAEIGAVLGWAGRSFGPAGALQEDGEWDYELQGVTQTDTPLRLAYDRGRGEVSLAPAGGHGLTTLTLTLSGSPAFCEAFREAFGVFD